MKLIRGVFILIILFFGWQVLSFDNLSTHPDLTGNAIDIVGAQYKFSSDQIKWIIKGSIAEDTDPRYLNHFYNSKTGKGLNDAAFQGISAKEWAQKQNSLTGDYSEMAILDNYKNGNYSRAFEGVGHIAHLIQDMSVPAHTRDDAHPEGDSFEYWAENYGKINLSKCKTINFTALDEAFNSLASYAGKNFLSKDTVIINADDFAKTEEYVDGKIRVYVNSNIEGINYKLAYTKNPDSLKPVYQVNDDLKLNLDYWNLLYPKAVGYSAGVIDYFERKFAEIDRQREAEEAKLSFWEKLKKEAGALKDNLQYAWGDTVLLTRNSVAGSYDLTSDLAKTGYDFTGYFVQSAGEALADAAINTAQTTKKIISSPVTIIEMKNKNTGDGKNNSSQGKTNDSKGNNGTSNNGKTKNNQEKINPQVLGEKIFSDSSENGKENTTENINETVPPQNRNFIFLSGPGPAQAESNGGNAGGSGSNSQDPSAPADTEPPDTDITVFPPAFASSTEAILTLNSTEPESRFECKIDGLGWEACRDQVEIRSLTEGAHNLEARAIDPASNADASPAAINWVVDLTAPVSTVAPLESQYFAPGFTVHWNGSDSGSGILNYDVQYKIDAGDWQDWLVATTSEAAIYDVITPDKKSIFFRSRSRDLAYNLESWPASDFGTASTTINSYRADHVVISKVKVAGVAPDDEYVELYNPTDAPVTITGWRLTRKSSGNKEYYLLTEFPATTIGPKRFFLIVHPTSYAGEVETDATYSSADYSLAPDNTVLLYSDNGKTLVDKLGMGTAADKEGEAAQNPDAAQSLERKAKNDSTAESMGSGGAHEYFGHGYDTDDNSNDFILTNTLPRNSSSPAEPAAAPLIKPGRITDLSLASSSMAADALELTWTVPENANLSAEAAYDLRYALKGSECALNRTWATATSVPVSILPLTGPAGTAQSAIINGLSAGTSYCFGIKVYNGQAWSSLSNQLSAATARPALTPAFSGEFSRRNTIAAKDTASTTPDESIVVFDFTNTPDRGAIIYAYFPGFGLGHIASWGSVSPAKRLIIELEYAADHYTGRYRYCTDNNSNVNKIANDKCVDGKFWGSARWMNNSYLSGQTEITVLNAGGYLDWQKP